MTDDETEVEQDCETSHPLPCRIDQDCEYTSDDADDFEIGSPADGDVIEVKEFDVTLADALDGLQDAEKYCASVGLDDLAAQCAETYQAVGRESPEWGDGGE